MTVDRNRNALTLVKDSKGNLVRRWKSKDNARSSSDGTAAHSATLTNDLQIGGHQLPEQRHHQTFEKLSAAFNGEGHELFVVGGAVRSLLLGHEPKDIDLCTSATPGETKELIDSFGSVYPLGERFGTIAVNIETSGMADDYEITTYRSESYDEGNRKPEVMFGGTLEDDLSRRDFTINAAAIDVEGNLVDPFGAADDIEQGMIRAVGEPVDRFNEDPLRIVRAARFAATLGFTVEQNTKAAMFETGPKLDTISRERIWAEVDRVVGNTDHLARFVGETNESDTTKRIFGTELDGTPPEGNAAAQYAWLAANGVNLHGMKAPRDVTRQAKLVNTMANSASPAEYRMAIRKNTPEVTEAAAVLRTPPEDLGETTVDQLRQPLPIDGNDLIGAGLNGPDIGNAIRKVEDSLISDPRWLTSEEALQIAAAN